MEWSGERTVKSINWLEQILTFESFRLIITHVIQKRINNEQIDNYIGRNKSKQIVLTLFEHRPTNAIKLDC